MAEQGLRERKKQRTKEALIDAALELFQRKGFEATTIEEIADAVQVSPRTFLRYFRTKEHAALCQIDEQLGTVLAKLAARPADEPVLTALREATVEAVGECESSGHDAEQARFRRLQELMAHSPTVRVGAIELSMARLGELAKLIAARMGVDLAVDPRPHLIASVAVCAVDHAVNAWREYQPDAHASDLIRQAFDLLSDGLNYPAAAAGTET